jgi:hypothetical protein
MHFVLQRQTGEDVRCSDPWRQHRCMESVNPGERYCATRSLRPNEACPIRPVRDVKLACDPLVS